MSIQFHPAVAAGGSTGQTSSSDNSGSSSTTSSSTVTSEKNMFLQLLVAQLQNQDPLNPVQGTDFVTQLAQFQQLEQSINTGADVSAIRSDLDELAAITAASTTSTGTTATQS
jgi:flagellar basal-body rod modification protein FlgD